jgi:hypothetical protein
MGIFIRLNEIKRQITLWRIYAWVYLLLSMRMSFTTDSTSELPFVLAILASILGIAGLLALFAYVYQRPLLTPKAWQVLFVSNIFMNVLEAVFFTDWSFFGGEPLSVVSIVVLLTIALIAPAFIAHFLYAFRCPKLWRRTTVIPT